MLQSSVRFCKTSMTDELVSTVIITCIIKNKKNNVNIIIPHIVKIAKCYSIHGNSTGSFN